jgi:hypothetical protein
VTGAQSFAERAHSFFGLEEMLASKPLERFAEQIAEPVNIGAQRRILRARPG